MAAATSLAKLIQDAQQQVALQSVSLEESGGSPKKAAALRRTKILHSEEEKKCPSGEPLSHRQHVARPVYHLSVWRTHQKNARRLGRHAQIATQ